MGEVEKGDGDFEPSALKGYNGGRIFDDYSVASLDPP